MTDRANNGGGLLVSLAMLFLLLAGGAGVSWTMVHGRLAAAQQATQARDADAAARQAADEARRQAELVRVQAEAALARATAVNLGLSPEQEKLLRAAVEEVLRTQEAAWNRGDVEAFVEHYWRSDDVTFSSGGKTTRGWAATLNGYRERYPTPEKMGRTSFSDLEITPLGDAAALVLGEWSLERETEPLSGNFTLVFRKVDDRWVIIHDHTSRRVED